jgi:DNA-binding NtrC family response regulator
MQKQVVIIDRDRVSRGQLNQALLKEGFDVKEFEAARNAMQHLLSSSVSAVIVNYNSAYERQNPAQDDGKRIVREIVNLDAFVPLVLICDRSEMLDPETVTAADLVLRRPITIRQLIKGVQSILEETLRERAQRKSGYISAFR